MFIFNKTSRSSLHTVNALYLYLNARKCAGPMHNIRIQSGLIKAR